MINHPLNKSEEDIVVEGKEDEESIAQVSAGQERQKTEGIERMESTVK